MATGASDRTARHLRACAAADLDQAGFASWESGALLLGAAGAGAAIGHGIPRYGWLATDPARASAPAFPRSTVQLSLRF